MPIRQTLDLPDIQLSYLEWNQGQTPLLLLHGLADHSLVWSSLGDYLAPKYHIVAPDLRGHGESSKPEQGYTFDDHIADLEALMDHLGWSSAYILGHSWAGKLVPIWAKQNPSRLRSLILVDPFFIGKIPMFLKVMFPLLFRVLPFVKAMGPFVSSEQAVAQAKQLKQYRGWSPFQQNVFKASIEPKPDGSWGSKFVVQARNEIFEDVMRVAGLTEIITIPTILIAPEKGLNRSDGQLKPYKTYLKNLTIRQVPGNHWPFLVEPEEFNRAVELFLEEQQQKPSEVE
ncbi:MAG: alpha/beta hydrolase [Moorea sp. SIO4A3]|nr:alpha/beta hydrolase [Moorena sp. SIO4A3]